MSKVWTAISQRVSMLARRTPSERAAPPKGIVEADKKSRSLPAHEAELYPWLAGSIEYSERYGTLVDDKRAADVRALVCLFLLAITIVAAMVFAGGTKRIPWVVQVDKTNWAVAVGPAEQTSPADPRILSSYAQRWVYSLRRVVGHAASQKDHVDQVYAMLSEGTPATKKVNAWYIANNPMVDVGSHFVEVEIARVYPMSDPMEWTIEWVEHHTSPTQGSVDRNFSASLSLQLSPTHLVSDLRLNELGIYVQRFEINELTAVRQ